MVVVAIIALLATLLSPLLSSARENSRRISCIANLRNIGFTFQQYAFDNKGRIPPGAISTSGHNAQALSSTNTPSSKINPSVLHLSYLAFHNIDLLRNPKVFKCPSRISHNINDGDKYNANIASASDLGHNQANLELSYPYFVNRDNSAVDATSIERRKLSEAYYGGETSIARDRIINHGYDFGNVLYGDGHVERKTIIGGALDGNTGTNSSKNSWLTYHNKTGLDGHTTEQIVPYASKNSPFQNKPTGLEEGGTISWANNLNATSHLDEGSVGGNTSKPAGMAGTFQ